MASRDYLKHVVATSEPNSSTIGDEYYNPSSNQLFKRLAVNGTDVQWVGQLQGTAYQASGLTVVSSPRIINFPGATLTFNETTGVLEIQSSGIPGGTNTNIQFNNAGAFGGSSNFTFNSSTQTLALTGFLTTFALSRSGNVNAPTWTTTSPVFNSAASVLTDVTGSGTIALKVGHSFLSPNFASSASTTITDAANLYVNSAVASTNTTITNNWALYVAGNQRVIGTLIADSLVSIVWTITQSGSADWVFSGPSIVAGNTNDPVLQLYRGFTYVFVNNAGAGHPFAIRVSNGGAAYTSGISGSATGTQTFTVPMNAPSTLYYQCVNHSVMGNTINIVDFATVPVSTSSSNSAFKIPFANTTVSTTGNYNLLQDSAADFTYNPSTNIMTVGGVQGSSTSTFSVNNAVTAAGTTQATAFAIATDIVNVTVSVANAGVRFPFRVAGHRIIVRNSTAVNVKVYPNTSAQINALGINVAYDIPATSTLEFVCLSSILWVTLNATFA